MRTRVQAGFTLIEITLVLAISSLLAASVLYGFSTLRQQAQFSDAVEQVYQTVLAQRQEAIGTVETSASGGTNAAEITIGQLLTFTPNSPNSSNITIQTLYTANPGVGNPVSGSQQVFIDTSQTRTSVIPWSIAYDGTANMQIAFTRSVTDGSLRTAAKGGGGWSLPLQYSDFAATSGTASITLADTSGRTANVIVNLGNNAVTRQF